MEEINLKKNISMFFPAYNEEDNIAPLVSSAKKVLNEAANRYEILIIVYEGSTDRTIDIVNELAKKDKRIRLIMQPKNKKGVGYAIRMGFDNAEYDLIFYSDSDNQFDLNDFRKFLPYLDNYDIIAGYRINRKDPLLRIFTSKIYNLMMQLTFSAKEKDLDCAFRLVNKKVFKKLQLICKLGLGTTELLVKARRAGFRIKQIGVRHLPRKAGKPVFQARAIPLPRAKVVFELLKEMKILWKDLYKK